MAKPSYESLVSQGRKAAKSQWTLGDLASKVETAYGEGKLQEYADDIGVPYETLKDYRRVAQAYQSGERSTDLPWSVYRILAAQADRAELVTDTALTASAARALVRGRKEASATPGIPPIEEDTWLGRAYPLIREVVEKRTGLSVPEKARVSLGWPRGDTKIGQHWSGMEDGVHHIFITPEIGDPVRALDVLTHEVVHAGLPPKENHGARFKKAMAAVGLEGKPKSTVAGPQLTVVLNDIAESLGVYPHTAIKLPPKVKTAPRESLPNTAYYECVDCQGMAADGTGWNCNVTVPRGLLAAGHGWPQMTCPIDGNPMEIIEDGQ